MSTPSDKSGGWRAPASRGANAGHKWQADHLSARGNRLSVKAKRAIAGLLTLGCAVLIAWLLLLWIKDSIPQAQVVTFGITDYQSPAIPKNRYGVEDSLAFKSLEQRNPRQFHVVDIPNNLNGVEILKRIGGDATGKNLIVFCSLHGRLAADASQTQVTAQFYGINATASGDVEPISDPNERKMVPIPDLLSQLRNSHAKNVLLLVEANQLQPNWPMGVLANEFVAQLQQHVTADSAANLCVLCSAGPFQTSGTLPAAEVKATVASESAAAAPAENSGAELVTTDEPVNQSVFAHFVLEGLKGKADGWGPLPATGKSDGLAGPRFAPKQKVRNRRVDVDELYAFVAQQVAEWGRHASGGATLQTVTRFGDGKFDVASVVTEALKLPPAVAAALPADASGDKAEKSSASTKAAKSALKKGAPAAAVKKAVVTATPEGSPPPGPSAADRATFEAVLFAKADDPKLTEALQAAMSGNAARRKLQQQILAQWLVEQALEKEPAQVVFNAQPLFAEIDDANSNHQLELLRRLLDLEQSASRRARLSEEGRLALEARHQAAELYVGLKSIPSQLLPELQAALKDLIAAERWQLVSAPNDDSRAQAREWYARFAKHRQAIQDGPARFARITKLASELRRRLPELARAAAERAEREHTDPIWDRLTKLAEWMEQDAAGDVGQVPPLDVLQYIPDLESQAGLDAQELLKFIRKSGRLDRLLQQPTRDAEFDQALTEIESDWNEVKKEAPLSDASINPHTAGLWQGFWAIEILRYRGLPKEDLSVLWQRWKELVHAASVDAVQEAGDEPTMRLQRVLLGSAIQQAWDKTGDGIPKSASPGGPSGTTTVPAEITALWKELEFSQPREPMVQFANPDGSPTGSSANGPFILSTTADRKMEPGTAQFQLTLGPSAQSSGARLKLRVYGLNFVEFSRDGQKAKSFEVDSPNKSITLKAHLSDKARQSEAVLMALVETTGAAGAEYPLEIRTIRVEPPFDPSLWRIVFKTDKAQPVQSLQGGAKLFLLPWDQVSLVPYLEGPVLPGVTGIDVKAYRIGAERDELLAEIKQVPLVKKASDDKESAATVRKDAADAVGEAQLTFNLGPPPPAAPAAGAAPTPPPEVAPQDISSGLKFEITPQGHPTVTYSVPIAFYSSNAFIEEPQPEFDLKERKIQIALKRKDFDDARSPLLTKSIFAELGLSPELVKFEAQSSSKVELKPTDREPKTVSVELTEIPEGVPEGELQFTLSVAGLPHAYRWNFLPGDPRPIRNAKTPNSTDIRIVSPSPAIAYWRKGETLQLFQDGEFKPAKIEVRIEVDAQQIDEDSGAGLWKLEYEMQDRSGALKDSYSWNLAASVNKIVKLSIKEGVWKLTTEARDFIYPVADEGLNGRFTLQSRLSRPGNKRVVSEHRGDLSIDSTPPAPPTFSKLPSNHSTGANLTFKVDALDRESGIYEIVAGIDLNNNRKLDDDSEKLATIDASRSPVSSPVQLTIPKNSIPAKGGTYNLIAVATNRARLTSKPTISDRIEFEPPPLPKEATTGTLKVVIDNAKDKNTWTLKGGETDIEKELPQFTNFHSFVDLAAGKYEIVVKGYSFVGMGTATVEVGKTKTIKITMQPR